eukprot:g19537.t1
MVLIEEVVEPPVQPKVVEPIEKPTLSKGFLEKAKEKPLYGPEGSSEGKVDPNTHKAHAEHKMNEDALAPGVTSMRFSFLQATDEDLEEDVTELDLSHNSIKDTGVQALVAALASGAAPKLRELKLYSNEFGQLGETMLTQGLPVFRKDLKVQWQEPSWAKLAREEAEGYNTKASPVAWNAIQCGKDVSVEGSKAMWPEAVVLPALWRLSASHYRLVVVASETLCVALMAQMSHWVKVLGSTSSQTAVPSQYLLLTAQEITPEKLQAIGQDEGCHVILVILCPKEQLLFRSTNWSYALFQEEQAFALRSGLQLLPIPNQVIMAVEQLATDILGNPVTAECGELARAEGGGLHYPHL